MRPHSRASGSRIGRRGVGLLLAVVGLGCPAGDPPPACEGVLQVSGVPSGLERCGSSMYRLRAVACDQPDPPRPCDASDLGVGTCTSDDACGEGEQCRKGVGDVCECVQPCASDYDCGEGFACMCALEPGETSKCLPARCRRDADCEGDARCQVDQVCVHGPLQELACQSDDDECRSTSDCETGTCRYSADVSRWQCREDCVQ